MESVFSLKEKKTTTFVFQFYFQIAHKY